jgi:hypothetical protein
MLKQNRNTSWKNRLTLLAIIGAVCSLSVSGILIRASDLSTLNIHSPISISSYLRDYALFPRPILVDSKQFKSRGDINNTHRLGSTENSGIARLLPRSLTLFNLSLFRISGCLSVTDTTYLSWLLHASKLVDVPPPPQPVLRSIAN